MLHHQALTSRDMLRLLRSGALRFGGNKKLKIYGKLNCRSGKRMKRENRVFFTSEEEAIASGYRPCGNCLSTKTRSAAKT